jgi:hypothetical protein
MLSELSLVINLGGLVEIFHRLKCFGIPIESLPLDMMGKFHLEYHVKWYQNRQAIETALHGGNATREYTRQLKSPVFPEPSNRLLMSKTGERMSEVSVSNRSINEQRGSSATAIEASGHIVEKRLEPLPYDYEPHENAVLCGRGRMCKEASGNLRLQSICKTFLKEYARDDAGRKEKSEIVSKIMEMVRASCAPSDGFVRFHDDRWWEVDGVIVRSKVTGILRDSLSSKYKSSTQAKVAKRRMQNVLSSVADQQGSKEDVQTTTL